jgi:hypothetical protein
MRRGIKLIKCFLTQGMIEDHSGRRLIPHFLPPMPRALATPRALDHATHSVDRGHGSIYATRISVSYRRQHLVRFYRALVLNLTLVLNLRLALSSLAFASSFFERRKQLP